MEQIRTGDPKVTETANYDAINALPPEEIIAQVQQYKNDPLFNVRMSAMFMASEAAQRSDETAVRRQGVEHLFDVATSDADPFITSQSSHFLAHSFFESDFSPAVKRSIHRILMAEDMNEANTNPLRLANFIRMAGTAQVVAATDRLQSLSDMEGDIGYSAILALARMGDETAISAIIAKVEADPNSTKSLIGTADAMAYIRQPEGVAALVKDLEKDPHHAMDSVRSLSKIIAGWPVGITGTASSNDVKEARAWIAQQGGAANLTIIR
jgi:HEAT repeat protein